MDTYDIILTFYLKVCKRKCARVYAKEWKCELDGGECKEENECEYVLVR